MQKSDDILQFDQEDNNSTSKKGSSVTQSCTIDKKIQEIEPLVELIKYTEQWLSETISSLFDNIDTHLFELAKKADSSSNQNNYFDAMRLIRLHRQKIHKLFIKSVVDNFSIAIITAEKVKYVETPDDTDNFTLVADDSLEQDLAIHSMIVKSERDNKKDLEQLSQRLNYLYNKYDKKIKIHFSNNPMGAASLCNSFASASSAAILDADIKIKLLIFKLFDIHFIADLDELYQYANESLIKKNILPDLKITYKGTIKKQPANATNSATENSTTTVQTSLGDAQTYALIAQLIKQNNTLPQNSQNPQNPQNPQNSDTQYASTDDVMQSFTNVQKNSDIVSNHADSNANIDTTNIHATNSGTQTSELLKAALTQALQSSSQKQALNQNDENLIDIIGMLFNFILDDDSLADSVKTLLSRLQIPIIKTALYDPDFFKNVNYPARKLLNELANMGLGITDSTNIKNNPLYLKLAEIVAIISNDTAQYNTQFYEELRNNLQAFLKKFAQNNDKKNIYSKSEVLDKINKKLKTHIGKKELPDNIVLFLEIIWSDVLFDIFATDGQNSDEWDMATTFVDTLIWSIGPKVNINSQKKLVKVIPGILKALNSGLNRINFPEHLREQLLQDLQDCHLAGMKGQKISNAQLSQDNTAYTSHKSSHKGLTVMLHQGKSPTDQQTNKQTKELTPEHLESIDAGIDVMLEGDLSNLDALDEENLLASLEDGSEQAIVDHDEADLVEDDYTQQARDLCIGAWVEFLGLNGQIYRAKISWRSDDAEAYIFVTQTGQIAEKSLQGLSNALRNKQATIIDESPVFERAMGSVLDDLKRD